MSDKPNIPTAVKWIMFVGEHYHPGVEAPDLGTTHVCRECGAVVAVDYLELHAAWHEAQGTREVHHHHYDPRNE